MFDRIIRFSLENKLLVILATLALIIIGIFSASRIPLDAVPDITNNQVQIVSTAPTLAPQEMEQLITFPLEAAMTNLPGVVEVRSISRYGLSVITVVFEEDMDGMLARQYVQEQLTIASASLPPGLADPELMPITTGLGEIYQYVLTVDKAHAHLYDATELRSLQDWIVKRQLNGTKGVIEISSFGGYLKQYEVALDPQLLKSYDLTVLEVINSLHANNQNSGGSYIEKGPYSFYIRTEGRVNSLDEIGEIQVQNKKGVALRVRDLGEVRIGSAKRYGAMTMDGKGEVVGGISLMLKGANSSEVLQNVKERMEKVERSLPEGVHIYPYLDRSKLIGKTIDTVTRNLIEGGLIVIFILLIPLGNLRAGLIVASVIPLAMLFALSMMHYFGISANLMSLGAIDFGIVIDGAVIIVEGLLHTLGLSFIGQRLNQKEMDQAVAHSTSKIYRSAAFGVLIILVVFIPILTLEGIEGKTFRPMAQTVGFAILGSMLLSMTYVPVMSALFLSKKIDHEKGIALRIMDKLKSWYRPVLHISLKKPMITVLSALGIFLFSLILFNTLGAEFVPTLEEGDIAMQQSIKPGSSLNESIHTSSMAEKILLDNFPEVLHVVSKIGTAEVPTDPMAIEDADVMIILKDKEEWTSASTREELMDKMKAKLAPITWAGFEFTQPIQLRFNELMTGSKSDISVKIFGEDVEVLKSKAEAAAKIISEIEGAGDIKVDQTDGLQQLTVLYDRDRLAQHGIDIDEANTIIRAAYAGETVGEIFEEERRYDLVVRLAPAFRQELNLDGLSITTKDGHTVPLSEIAQIKSAEGPMLISREQARRFINIGVNVRNRDVASLVADIQTDLGSSLELPSGYEIQYGGAFENLKHASSRLLIAVPIALALILLLLYLAFGSISDTLVIFMAVPLSAVGGILALWLRGMPFSISSGIGFIALFGVSVLNGIVLLGAIKQLKQEDFPDLKSLIGSACLSRLRPVMMTAAVAALGFLPMALSTGSGAEVQRPLASVVIGGLISSTLLTLLVLPTLYFLIQKRNWRKTGLAPLLLFMLLPFTFQSQSIDDYEALEALALQNHPGMKNLGLEIDKERLNEKAKVIWGPMNIQYQNGQINYDGIDQQIQATQDISPLIRFEERKRHSELIDARIGLLEVEQDIGIRKWKADLHTAYEDWRLAYSHWRLKAELSDLYTLLEPKINRMLEAGASDAVEYALFQSEAIRIHQEAVQAEQAWHRSEGVLRTSGYFLDDVQISPNKLDTLPWLEKDWEYAQSVFAKAMTLSLDQLEKDTRLQITKTRQASLSAGYFGQSLENVQPFQGFLVGLHLPLDTRLNNVRKKQLHIQTDQWNNEAMMRELEFNSHVKVRKEEMASLHTAILTYQEKLLPDQADILRRITLQFETGDIDFIRYSQIQEKLIQAELNHLEIIRRYNGLVIELSLLTQ